MQELHLNRVGYKVGSFLDIDNMISSLHLNRVGYKDVNVRCPSANWSGYI